MIGRSEQDDGTLAMESAFRRMAQAVISSLTLTAPGLLSEILRAGFAEYARRMEEINRRSRPD